MKHYSKSKHWSKYVDDIGEYGNKVNLGVRLQIQKAHFKSKTIAKVPVNEYSASWLTLSKNEVFCKNIADKLPLNVQF